MKNEKNEEGMSYRGGFATSEPVVPENIPVDLVRLGQAVAGQQLAIEAILKALTTIGLKINNLDEMDRAHAAAVKKLVELADDQAASLKKLVASVLRGAPGSGSGVN